MLQVKNISFSYTHSNIIQGINFEVKKGQNIAVLGESGCGKSTLLQLIYGLYDLDEGQIFWNENEILGPKFHLVPGMPFMKYLAQDFDLMPFITVEENVGKFLSNIYKDKKQQRVYELLDMVEMTSFAKIKAKNLSGGQQQRVALARVLALEPEVLLLDEPFSQIDTFRKNTLRRNLFKYLKEQQITCIIATHDSNDALSFSDETIIMQNGKIVAKDNPVKLFENPISKYQASLFGEVNEIPEAIINPAKSSQKTTLIYPHQLVVSHEYGFKVTIVRNYFRGNHFLVEAQYDGGILFFESIKAFEIRASILLTLDNPKNQQNTKE